MTSHDTRMSGAFGGHVTIPLNAKVICRPGQWAAMRPFLDRPNYSITLYGQVTPLVIDPPHFFYKNLFLHLPCCLQLALSSSWQEMEFLKQNVIGPKVFPDVELQA